MQKVEGVESVRVSLKDGLTILDLKPGNAVTLARLRQVIRNNGFVSREVELVATGSQPSKDVFEVSGTRERLPVTKITAEGADQWRLTTVGSK